jgi:hypothetical protein
MSAGLFKSSYTKRIIIFTISQYYSNLSVEIYIKHTK